MPAVMPGCMTCCGRWRRRAEKKEKREPLFGGSLLRFRPPAGAGVSLLQQLGRARHFSLDLPQCFKDIVQNEFFHDGGASLYFHYDIINPQPEQRLLRRRLYPVFPDKNPYYAEQDCK